MSEWSTEERLVEEAVGRSATGRPVVLPTDTVYGLCTTPLAPESLLAPEGPRAGSADRARSPPRSTSCSSSSPSCRKRLVRSLLPGRLTLIVPNPEHRFPLLAGSRPDTIGVRVPDSEALRGGSSAVGAVAATSANLTAAPTRGGSRTCRRRFASMRVVVDGGELPGTPSTVVDLTGDEPRMLREGACRTVRGGDRTRPGSSMRTALTRLIRPDRPAYGLGCNNFGRRLDARRDACRRRRRARGRHAPSSTPRTLRRGRQRGVPRPRARGPARPRGARDQVRREGRGRGRPAKGSRELLRRQFSESLDRLRTERRRSPLLPLPRRRDRPSPSKASAGARCRSSSRSRCRRRRARSGRADAGAVDVVVRPRADVLQATR